MKLLLSLCFYMLLSGCAVSYLIEEGDTASFGLEFECPDTFSFSGQSDFTDILIDEGDMFRLTNKTVTLRKYV